jgi:hypothetical protein
VVLLVLCRYATSSESIRLLGWLMQSRIGPTLGCRTSTRSKKNQIQNRAITLTTA